MCRTGWRAELDCLCHEGPDDWYASEDVIETHPIPDLVTPEEVLEYYQLSPDVWKPNGAFADPPF